MECELVFRAIGYRGLPLPGLPFDDARGIVPNDGGRVTDPGSGRPLAGEYVVGWIKRGPSGVIGTNKKDSQDTVDALIADLTAATDLAEFGADHADELASWLIERQPKVVTDAHWKLIDEHERSSGEPHGRPRVKLPNLTKLLHIGHG